MLSKLIRQTGTLISGNLSASVLNFFSVALSLKALGVESFGEVTLLQAYILVLSLCFNPQAWQGVIRYFYLEKDKASLIVLTLKYDLICALIGTLIAICFAQTYAESFNLQHHTNNISRGRPGARKNKSYRKSNASLYNSSVLSK